MPKEILKIIADNPALFDEMRRVFELEFDTLPAELGFSNERLGERVRARLEGREAIERACQTILTFRTTQPKENGINPAR